MNAYLPWLIFLIHISLLLLVDFYVLHRKGKVATSRRSLFETIFFVTNALLFTGVVYWLYSKGLVANINQLSPSESVVKFITGYLIELSLSVDNLFVIAIIFSAYKVPSEYQHRLLFLGILGAIIFRAILIALGLVLMHKIEGISVLFGLFLLYTSFKMLKKDESEVVNENSRLNKYFRISKVMDGDRFRTVVNGKKVFTALFGALLTIEFTDLMFALDSIPAIFAITTDPFLVFTSNIYAIMGLRSLYFFLANMLERFRYLKYSVFSILIFVSLKLITSLWLELPEWFSLMFIGASLAMGVWVSIARKDIDDEINS